jgi:pimeloyl-ACP methyl ester carboxylesterase
MSVRVDERIIDVGGGVSLCYELLGSAGDPPVLLIMGLGQQLMAWPDELCDGLIQRGLQVIRFDNRDTGRSTHLDFPPPRLTQLLTRRFDPRQYGLEDMARDTAGLVAALSVGPVHAVGVSMGGMIAQTLAASYPDQVRSLVSIMSSTGSRRAGWVAPSTLRLLFSAPPRDREAAAELALAMWRHIGSRGFERHDQEVADRARRAFDRDPRGAAGAARQMAAILKSGDRTAELRGIGAPTLVIHGDHDLMIHPTGGKATAEAIPGARLTTIEGMGHDLPAGALTRLVELIAEHASRSDRQRAQAAA